MHPMRITHEIIDDLARRETEHAVSILLPAHPKGAECRQDPIRLRNLTDDAVEQLRVLDVHDPESHVTPLRNLHGSMPFWEENAAQGIGFFLDGEDLVATALPYAPEAISVVDSCFYVKPLLPAANRDSTFHILAFGQNDIRLFRADAERIEPIDLPDAPEDFDEIMGLYVQDEHIQFHSGTGEAEGGGGDRRAMYHGQGVTGDETDHKKKLIEYCRRIEDAVSEKTVGGDRIILAAAEPAAGLYRHVSRDPHLDPRTLEGNPERRSARDLHAEAVDMLKGYFESDRKQAVEDFGSATGQDLAAVGLEDVLHAAERGQAGVVFLREGEHRWGRYDPAGSVRASSEEREPGDGDLLNRAAVQTLRSSGRAFLVSSDELPAADPAAAVLRYPVASS